MQFYCSLSCLHTITSIVLVWPTVQPKIFNFWIVSNINVIFFIDTSLETTPSPSLADRDSNTCLFEFFSYKQPLTPPGECHTLLLLQTNLPCRRRQSPLTSLQYNTVYLSQFFILFCYKQLGKYLSPRIILST